MRTSLSPRLVTPAAYLLPSAMSFSRRAATRGSTTPMGTPLEVAWRRGPTRLSSTASPGLTWASSRELARSTRWAKPVLPVSSTKMLTGALLPGLAGTVFLPASARSVRRRLMLRSAMRLVGSSASAA